MTEQEQARLQRTSVIFNAKCGLMPNTCDKGFFAFRQTIDISHADHLYKSWLNNLENKYDDFFVTGLGWRKVES